MKMARGEDTNTDTYIHLQKYRWPENRTQKHIWESEIGHIEQI